MGKKIKIAIFPVTVLIFFLFIYHACAISRSVGPFMGKIVAGETKEPLEGAVVLVWFHTKAGTLGGSVSTVADVFETLTDIKGEFLIPKTRVTLFRVFEWWSKRYKISIFKPGYGAYPRHLKAFRSPELKRFWKISEKEHNTYFLPKLLTIEERKENLMDIERPYGKNFRYNKMPNLRRLKDEERFNMGLDKKKGKL